MEYDLEKWTQNNFLQIQVMFYVSTVSRYSHYILHKTTMIIFFINLTPDFRLYDKSI